MRARILIVDDDPRFRALARRLLEAAGHAVVAEAADGPQALAALRQERPDTALVDVQLPDTNGLELARVLAATDNNLRIVMTSADQTLVPPAALKESAASAFVPKHELASTDLAPLLRSSARP
jgi:CheY-like chemotaxis protein